MKVNLICVDTSEFINREFEYRIQSIVSNATEQSWFELSQQFKCENIIEFVHSQLEARKKEEVKNIVANFTAKLKIWRDIKSHIK